MHNEFEPLGYKLQIFPTFQRFFTGTVDILINCANNTEIITLNAENLLINNKNVYVMEHVNKTKLQIQNQKFDNRKFIFIITLNTPLLASNNYIIHIEFSGSISNYSVGLYQTLYNKNE